MFSATFLPVLAALAMSPIVSACEGDCIMGVTNAWVGNYTPAVVAVLSDLADQISTQLIPPSNRPSNPLKFIEPIFAAYRNESYNSMEYAIFPSFFHGKCQRYSPDGQDPPGCPNPDCPVICGTPGSLVHFYSSLRYIAYNDTTELIKNLTKPSSTSFKAVLKAVENAQNMKQRRFQVRHAEPTKHYDLIAEMKNGSSSMQKMKSDRAQILPYFLRRNSKTSSSMNLYDSNSFDLDSHGKTGSSDVRGSSSSNLRIGYAARKDQIRRETSSSELSTELQKIFAQSTPLMKKACGGDATNTTNALPNCSWETAMKAFILTYN